MENLQNNILNKDLDHPLYDDNYEKILETIFQSKKHEVDIRKSIFEDDKKRKSCDFTQNTLDFIRIKDRNYDDFFVILDKYEKIMKKWTTTQNTSKIFSQLNNSNIYDSTKGENNPCVGPLSSIENMVESTYGYNRDWKYSIAEEICYMKLIAFKWRGIKGDGNCYYRSVIFTYLENLIMQKDISNIQRIMIDIDEKFDGNYKNTKCLSYVIRDSIVKLDRRLIMTIFKIIIDELDMCHKNDSVQNALMVLIKAFNFSKTFDTAMIMYLRYILYEFILENKEKFYSEDFPVKIGNLLPYQYEMENGDFLFEKFFVEELLKFYTYAEKIVIYLTPFVLNVDLNIIFYDFGRECNIQVKNFFCYLKDKPIMTILYRKAHYDVAYKKESFLNDFSYFSNKEDKLKVVDQRLIEYYDKNEIQKVDVKRSKIFNKKEKLMRYLLNEKQPTNISDCTESDTTITTNITNISTESTKSEEKPKCICDNIKHKISLDENQNEDNPKNVIDYSSKECKNNPLENNNNNIYDDEIRSMLCIECKEEKDCKSLKSYKLPCGCYLCGKDCIEKFLIFLFKNYKINKKEDLRKCDCTYEFNIQEMMLISSDVSDDFKFDKPKNDLINQFKSICMYCLKESENNESKLIKKYKCEKISKYFKTRHLYHYTCSNCSSIKSK